VAGNQWASRVESCGFVSPFQGWCVKVEVIGPRPSAWPRRGGIARPVGAKSGPPCPAEDMGKDQPKIGGEFQNPLLIQEGPARERQGVVTGTAGLPPVTTPDPSQNRKGVQNSPPVPKLRDRACPDPAVAGEGRGRRVSDRGWLQAGAAGGAATGRRGRNYRKFLLMLSSTPSRFSNTARFSNRSTRTFSPSRNFCRT